MGEFFEAVAQIAVLVFVVACMAAAGLGLGLWDVIAPLRRPRLVLAALFVNFAIAPAAAFGLVSAFSLDPPYAKALFLLSAAAGAPFLPKLAQLAKGDIAFSVGLMLLLTVGTVVFLPLGLPMLIPGESIDAWPILRSLVVTMLVPLATGMLIRNCSPWWADRVRQPISLLSNVSMLLAVALLIGLHLPAMLGLFGSGAIALADVLLALLVASGYALGGPALSTRSVLGLGSGQRNIAAALIVATQGPEEATVVVMLITSTLAGLIVLVPAALWFARRSTVPEVSR